MKKDQPHIHQPYPLIFIFDLSSASTASTPPPSSSAATAPPSAPTIFPVHTPAAPLKTMKLPSIPMSFQTNPNNSLRKKTTMEIIFSTIISWISENASFTILRLFRYRRVVDSLNQFSFRAILPVDPPASDPALSIITTTMTISKLLSSSQCLKEDSINMSTAVIKGHHLDSKPFSSVSKRKYSEEKEYEKTLDQYSEWNNYRQHSCHHLVTVEGSSKEEIVIIDEHARQADCITCILLLQMVVRTSCFP